MSNQPNSPGLPCGVGPRQPGRDGIDRDPEIADLGRQRPRESDQAAFARGIVRVEADTGMKGRGGDADDAAPALLFHCGQEGFHQQKDGVEIDG